MKSTHIWTDWYIKLHILKFLFKKNVSFRAHTLKKYNTKTVRDIINISRIHDKSCRQTFFLWYLPMLLPASLPYVTCCNKAIVTWIQLASHNNFAPEPYKYWCESISILWKYMKKSELIQARSLIFVIKYIPVFFKVFSNTVCVKRWNDTRLLSWKHHHRRSQLRTNRRYM